MYHFSQYQAGLTFAPLLIGGLLAIPVMAIFDRLTYQKARAEAIRSGTEVHPEKRLYPAMLSVLLLPISLFVRHLIFPTSFSQSSSPYRDIRFESGFVDEIILTPHQWLAWSGRPSVHWIVPALSGILFGLAYVLNIVLSFLIRPYKRLQS